MVDKVLSDCRALQSSTSSYCEDSLLPLIPGHKRKNYRSLMTRPVCGMWANVIVVSLDESVDVF